MSSLPITLYSDFVCPFCFIAERGSLRRLEAAYDVAVDWRGFELHPETPAGGVPLASLLPGPVLAAMRGRLERFAERQGVELNIGGRMPNTRAAIAVCEFARAHGVLDAFRDAAMEAHWLDGRDLEDRDVLAELADAAGLDPSAAVDASSSGEWMSRVDALRKEASDRGVMGIPTFFLDRFPVVGAQDYDSMVSAAVRAGACRRPSPPLASAANSAMSAKHR